MGSLRDGTEADRKTRGGLIAPFGLYLRERAP